MRIFNVREMLYFAIVGIRGQKLGQNYHRFLKEAQQGVAEDTTRTLLIRMFDHCKENVPYYRDIILKMGDSYRDNPQEYLSRFPVLTKPVLRENFEKLKSLDIKKRHWFYNTSGGSTGVPTRMVQDYDFDAWVEGVHLVFDKLLGREVGDLEIKLWGSLRDVTQGTEGWKAILVNWVKNTKFINSFRISPEQMRQYIELINTAKPRIITSYVQTLYEIAKYAEHEGIEIHTNGAVTSTAGKLFPSAREKVERVFNTQVYDRYGSRELGDVAGEIPNFEGMWVPPWANYVEITDQLGEHLPDGEEGEILVTSLCNFAMPMIRYQVGDRGIMSTTRKTHPSMRGQVMKEVMGRSLDSIINCNGEIIPGEYMTVMLFLRDWVKEYQVVQKGILHIVFRIILYNFPPEQKELDEITAKVRLVMGCDCQVDWEFVNEIPDVGTSGKRRYVLSEVSKN
jgi:phenylacetate-CoA ligase